MNRLLQRFPGTLSTQYFHRKSVLLTNKYFRPRIMHYIGKPKNDDKVKVRFLNENVDVIWKHMMH